MGRYTTYKREWMRRNKDKTAEYRRTYDERHPGRKAAMDRASYERRKSENPEAVAMKARQQAAKYRAKHPERHLEGVRAASRNRANRRGALMDARKAMGCSVCGEDDPCCLDFHHTDPGSKIGKVSALRFQSVREATFISELGKCIVLCANCHRKEHRKMRLVACQS